MRAAVLAALAVSALSAVRPAGAYGADSGGAAAALADRYAPVVRLVAQQTPCGGGEPFEPVSVDAVLDNDQVALRGPWDDVNVVKVAPSASDLAAGLPGYHLDFPGSALRPGCSYDEWQRELDLSNRPAVYARAVTEPGKPGRLALQYWFFYIYNDFNNKHEGDWEMIQLDFAAGDAAAALRVSPTEVGYSQHDGAERAAWDDSKLQKVDGTHPVVYPAEGSHANYYRPALYLGSSAAEGVGCDNTQGPWRELRPDVVVVPADTGRMLAEYPWLGFLGNWGERHPAFYNGPTGPNVHFQWTAPISWAQERWHPSAFAVPAGLTFAPRSTDLFCAGVAGGSNLLTAVVRGGPAVFLTVLAVILLALWGAVRVEWKPSQPLHLARRRGLGQMLAASARMYRRSPRLYLTIGALFLPVSVVVALLQRALFALTHLDVLSTVAGPSNAAVAGSALAFGIVFDLLTLTVVQAATAAAVKRTEDGVPVSGRDAYRRVRPRLPSLVAALVLVAVVVAALHVTVIGIPVEIWLVVRWSLFSQCVVLEELSWWAALRRSSALVRGRWWRVAGITLAVVGLSLLLGPLTGVGVLLLTPASLAVVNVVSGIIYTLTIPYAAIATTYLYYDLRVREALAAEPEVLPAEAAL
jgi:Vacuolar protein sorting-associated protein 62